MRMLCRCPLSLSAKTIAQKAQLAPNTVSKSSDNNFSNIVMKYSCNKQYKANYFVPAKGVSWGSEWITYNIGGGKVT